MQYDSCLAALYFSVLCCAEMCLCLCLCSCLTEMQELQLRQQQGKVGGAIDSDDESSGAGKYHHCRDSSALYHTHCARVKK